MTTHDDLVTDRQTQPGADPDRFAEGYAKIMMGSFVPSAVGAVSNVVDPYVRTADLTETVHGVPEAMARRIPWLSKEMPIRYNPLGQPVERRQRTDLGWMPKAMARGMSPIEMGVIDPNAFVEAELNNLSQFHGMPPSMPSASVTINMTGSIYGDNVKLTDQEYAMYHRYHRAAREQMAEAILSPDWSTLPPEIKAQTLSGIYRSYQREAREAIKMEVYNRLSGGVDTQ